MKDDRPNDDEELILNKRPRLSQQRRIGLIFDPFVFSILVLIFLIILSVLIYSFVFLIYPVIKNFDQLVSNDIPAELEYLHEIIRQHNQTLTMIEGNLLEYFNTTNIIVTENNFHKINHIIQNVDFITSTLNVTQLQNNIQDIVNDLNKIIHS